MSENPLKVVPIRDGRPLLNDLPGQLRQLADDIESGRSGPYEWGAFIGMPPEEFLPQFSIWGVSIERHTLAGVFLHLANRALTDKVEDDDS